MNSYYGGEKKNKQQQQPNNNKKQLTKTNKNKYIFFQYSSTCSPNYKLAKYYAKPFLIICNLTRVKKKKKSQPCPKQVS